MKNVIIPAIILLLAFCSYSCGKKKTHVDFSRQDLPAFNTGDWWWYRIIDSLNGGAVDTLRLTITSSAQSGDTLRCACTVDRNGTVIDTNQMIVTPTMFYFYSDTALFSYTIPLPFAVGDAQRLTNDSYYTVDYQNILSYQTGFVVLSQSNDVYNVKMGLSGFEFGYGAIYQLSKGIGIVSADYGHVRTGYRGHKTQQLIDYSVH